MLWTFNSTDASSARLSVDYTTMFCEIPVNVRSYCSSAAKRDRLRLAAVVIEVEAPVVVVLLDPDPEEDVMAEVSWYTLRRFESPQISLELPEHFIVQSVVAAGVSDAGVPLEQ